MHGVLLIALVVFAVAVVAGGAVALVRAASAWRAFRSFRGTVLAAVAETGEQITATEERLATAAARAAELDRARRRLQSSLTTASVLMAAAQETREALARRRATDSGT